MIIILQQRIWHYLAHWPQKAFHFCRLQKIYMTKFLLFDLKTTHCQKKGLFGRVIYLMQFKQMIDNILICPVDLLGIDNKVVVASCHQYFAHVSC